MCDIRACQCARRSPSTTWPTCHAASGARIVFEAAAVADPTAEVGVERGV